MSGSRNPDTGSGAVRLRLDPAFAGPLLAPSLTMPIRNVRTAAIWRGIALGAVWTVAFVALASLADALDLAPNPAYRTFEWINGLLPGWLVTWAIDHLVALVRSAGAGSTAAAAKTIEKAIAVGITVVIGAIAGGVIADLVRRPVAARAKWGGKPLDIGLATGAAAAAIYLLVIARDRETVMILCTIAGFLTWGGVLGASIGATATEQNVAERRHVLLALGALAAGTTIVASGLARLLRRSSPRTPPLPTTSPVQSASRLTPAPGTRPELTATEHFYRVDIDVTPPAIERASWRLELGGLFAHPRTLTLDELRARPAVTQVVTLECISNPVGGDLIGTCPWTGCSLGALLDELGLAPGARFLSLEAADGFHESVDLVDAHGPRAMLAYAMNGEPLTAEHGFPLRLYLPDRHGMKLPKWIRRIDAVAEAKPGYWVERGWSATAIPHTTSVIDTARRMGDQLAIGGIAYAGARGISKVEVQLDGGPWRPAQLRTPALSQLTWVQWRLDAPYAPGSHTIRVRAYDGTGAPQDTTVRPPHPDGATGLHEKKITV
jgi:DMSO/TMAO reductase YedYZ molybdopterin-dependent catalytic subunit